MKKKFCLLIAALMCAVAQGAWADTWDGQTAEKPEYHNSSDGFYNVVKITKASELAYVRQHFTDAIKVYYDIGKNTLIYTNKHYYELNYLLCDDIDMGDAVSWKALGNYDQSLDPFTGTFYGQGHTIRIHTSGAEYNYQGLIAKIGNGGKVQDLHVSGIVQCNNSRLVGGIAGENLGTIQNCWVSADVSSGWREASSLATAKVGGIAGENSGIIHYCCMTGNVSNDDADVGGIVGYHKSGNVSHCTFYGTRSSNHSQHDEYIGDQDGATEDLHTSFTDDELTSHLSNCNAHAVYCEGVREPFTITVNNETEGALTASLTKARPGQTVTLTPAANNSIVHLVVKTVDGNVVGEWYSPLAASYAITMPQRDIIVTTSNALWAGKGTQAEPYLISTAGEWEQIHTQMSEATDNNVFSTSYFKQTANIDITQSIGAGTSKAFCGTYDGDGYRLNCTLTNSTEALAPFYKVKGATIKNVYVTGTISGGIHTAGLVAYTDGTVTVDNCRVSAAISCTGNSQNNAHGGGIVGHANSSNITVTDCLFDGSLTASANDGGSARLGAIIGWGGSSTTVNSCVENATFTTTGQTAFCWKDGTSTIDSSYGNRYLSDLSQANGADKLYTVTSGTENLEIVFPDNCYDWQVAYHGAMFKSSTDNAYLIRGQFYTVNSSVNSSNIQFDVEYPESWTNVVVYNGQTPLTNSSGHYSFQQGDANTVITATYEHVSWIDEGNYAENFQTESDGTVIIETEEELARLAYLIRSGEATGEGKTYKLNDDLNMSGKVWKPIGGSVNGNLHRFRGTFDGQGHTIQGITVEGTDQYVGLFGLVNGTVKNVRLENSSIQGSRYVGGIAGDARFDIINCYVDDDVTVTANEDCGGVVGHVQNQSDNNGKIITEAWIRGCYSAAKVNGVSHVGGIVGALASGTVHYNVSQAKVTATDGTVAYVVGNNSNGTTLYNFYISDNESSNSTDVRAYHVTLSDELKESGYLITYETSEDFDRSQLHFSMENFDNNAYVRQFKMGDEWYAPKAVQLGTSSVDFRFYIAHEHNAGTLDNVKVNGVAAEQANSGFYRFGVSGEAVITGDFAVTLYDNSDGNSTDEGKNNLSILRYTNGMNANVTLQGRKLYRDNHWNTICLPFDHDVSQAESPLYGATFVRALQSSDFDSSTGTLTLTFADHSSKIFAGVPYIIKWESGYSSDIENPKFKNVTIKYDSDTDPIVVGVEDSYPVEFRGNYVNTSFPKKTNGYKNFLYVGENDQLYYPDGTADMTINSFRAYFRLKNGLVAGETTTQGQSGIRTFVLDFGDGEETVISEELRVKSEESAGAWFDLQGRRLSGKPTTPGLYINNGIKVAIK